MAKRINLLGAVFGMITVLEQAPSRAGKSQKKTQWKVRCRCGTVFFVDTGELTRLDGKARISCGCQNHRKGAQSSVWRGLTYVSAKYFKQVQSGASLRGISFEVTIQDLEELLIFQEFKCSLSGRHISISDKTASLDRIDSSTGYAKNNIQWLHKDINRIKSDFPQEYFIKMCVEVANNVR